jgi:ABC-2 type transport system permease protein
MTTLPVAARAVTGLAFRHIRRGAIVVTVLCAGMSLLVAATYESTVGSESRAASLAVLAGNPAIRTLFGSPVALDDAGGFTVWRTGTVVAVLLGVWGLLAVTRTTRGEEDAGRWDLLLAGRLPLAQVVRRQLGVLAASMTVAGAAIAAALVAAGTDPRGAVLHGTSMALVGMFFVGVGGIASEIFPSRTPATGVSVAVLGAALLLRMVADGVAALTWLRWVSPFGLVEETGPYDVDRIPPLLVLALAAAVSLVGGPALATRRDVRGGWLVASAGREPRLRMLGSAAAFAVRRALRPLTAWSIGIGAYYLLIGLIAVSMTGFLADNPEFADLAGQAGFDGLGTIEGYVATLFALLAMPIGGFVTIRLAATAADEAERRLVLLYAGPLTRRRVATAEVAVAGGGAVALAMLGGLTAWAGTALTGAELSPGAALAGALNVLPVVTLSLGASVLALGFAPRMVTLLGCVPAVGGFLLLVIGQSVAAPAWLMNLSPYRHLAAVPDVTPDWGGAFGMLIVAAAFGLFGVRGYERRDLRG